MFRLSTRLYMVLNSVCVDILLMLHIIVDRPISESESERQRARNGASESERDYSCERAIIHTSESKRAKFRMRHNFSFYSALQWSNDVCGIYRTYRNPVSVQFPLFQHQHSTNMGCYVCGLPSISVNYIPVYRFTAFQTGPVRDNTCIVHTRVKSHKTSKNPKSYAAGAPRQIHRGSLRCSPDSLVGGLRIG